MTTVFIPLYGVGPDGVCTCRDGAQCHSPGKHPVPSKWTGDSDFTTPTDLDTDHAGVRLDDYVVIDCDTPEAAEAFIRTEATAAATYRVRTGRGQHFYYQRPVNAPDELHSMTAVVDDIDIKTGAGSYVVAEGSIHPNGARYERIGTGEALPMPPIVLSLLRHRQSGPSSSPTGGGDETWEEIPEGRRNVTLAAIGGTLRKQGMAPVEIMRTLSGINKAYCRPPMGVEELKLITRSVSRYEVDPDIESVTIVGEDIELLNAHDMGKPPDRTWLWDPYVPDCTMTLVSGREGIGKGMFCAYMAACMTTGVHPDGTKHKPKPVLWLSAEDHPHLDIWPRLRAAGWDPSNPEHERVHFTDPRTLVVLPDDMSALRDVVEAGGYGLVIMDPGRSYIGTREKANVFSYNNESDIRPALQQLLYLSADLNLPFLFVAHWKKGDGPVADATSGSIAWKQVVRHALDFAEVENEAALWVGKSNAGVKGAVRGYHVEAAPEHDTARFVLGELLPFDSLDAWLKDARSRAGSMDVSFFVGLAEHYGEENLTAGDVWPSVKTMPALIPGIPKGRTSEDINKALLASGVIERRGRQYQWVGTP